MKEDLLSCGLQEKVCLTNRFNLVVCVYSDNPWRVLKRGKNKEERCGS